MEGRPRIHHPLSSYLEMTKDKNGMIKTRLKIPYWNRQEPQPPVDLSDEDICIIGEFRKVDKGQFFSKSSRSPKIAVQKNVC